MLICAGNKVKTELGKYYSECLLEVDGTEAEQLEKAGENVYRKNGKSYIGKFLPLEIFDEDNDSHCTDEVMKIITADRSGCADEILQSDDVKRLLHEVIDYMNETGLLDRKELELISRCFGFRSVPENLADIERDWKRQGKNTEGENLYNLRRSVLGKMQKIIRQKPEWRELSFHAGK